MVQFNRSGKEFFPIGDPGVDFETARDLEPEAKQNAGLYYRAHAFPELLATIEAAQLQEQGFGNVSLEAYQSWNEIGWKAPHASFAAVERFGEKVKEEAREVDDAIEDFFDTRDRTHLIEELGDYLWVATSFANNGAAVVSDAIKRRLYAYAVGTRVWENGGFREPEWYQAAASLAVKRDAITVEDIDDLVSHGFVPRFSPVMNLYDEEEICLTGFAFDFMSFAAFLNGVAQQQYKYGEDKHIRPQPYSELSEDVGNMVAEIYFRVGAIAFRVEGSFAEVIERNIRKISERVRTGTVDREERMQGTL